MALNIKKTIAMYFSDMFHFNGSRLNYVRKLFGKRFITCNESKKLRTFMKLIINQEACYLYLLYLMLLPYVNKYYIYLQIRK